MPIKEINSGGGVRYVKGTEDQLNKVRQILISQASIDNGGQALEACKGVPQFRFNLCSRNLSKGVLFTTGSKTDLLNKSPQKISLRKIASSLRVIFIPTCTAEKFLRMYEEGKINYEKLKFMISLPKFAKNILNMFGKHL